MNYLTGMSPARLDAVADRFWMKVDVGDCWLWLGCRAKRRLPSGAAELTYGRFQVGKHPQGGSRVAHRIAWELLIGPTPDDLDSDHLCQVKHCVNPDHLEWITHHENMRRSDIWNRIRRRTHCPEGHEYDLWLPKATKGPQRGCSICMAAHARRYAARRKHLRPTGMPTA